MILIHTVTSQIRRLARVGKVTAYLIPSEMMILLPWLSDQTFVHVWVREGVLLQPCVCVSQEWIPANLYGNRRMTNNILCLQN